MNECAAPSRREILLAGSALAVSLLGGCAQASQANAARPLAMTVYRDPGCGCCENWAALARRAGYQTTLIDAPDMQAVKRRLGVPAALAACHTAVAGGYVFEGHVPFAQMARLLRERRANIKGLAVPGMPAGSPGMEMPDGSQETFQVISFDAAGRSGVYR